MHFTISACSIAAIDGLYQCCTQYKVSVKVLCVCSAVAYRADGMTAENKRLREKVAALEKEIQGGIDGLPCF